MCNSKVSCESESRKFLKVMKSQNEKKIPQKPCPNYYFWQKKMQSATKRLKKGEDGRHSATSGRTNEHCSFSGNMFVTDISLKPLFRDQKNLLSVSLPTVSYTAI